MSNKSTNDPSVPVSEGKLEEDCSADRYLDAPSANTQSLGEEDATSLKHVDVIETELSELQPPKSIQPSVVNENRNPGESTASEQDMQAQEARVQRISFAKWRELKNSRAIDPKLPTLLVSLKVNYGPKRRPTGRKIQDPRDTPNKDHPSPEQESIFDVPHRLVINSKILLDLLGVYTGTDFPEERNAWLRPFKPLIAYEMEIRQALIDAEIAVKQVEAVLQPSVPRERHLDDKTVDIPSTSLRSPKAIKNDSQDVACMKAQRDQLRCLVGFMDSDMQDIFDIKRQVAEHTIKEIAFEHLWLLYEPGCLVYRMKRTDEIDTYQAYRVLHITGGRRISNDTHRFRSYDSSSDEEDSNGEEKAHKSVRVSIPTMTSFVIDCFSMDFDGNIFGPKSRVFEIPPYTGLRRLDTLEVCPSFFRHERIGESLVRRGRRFTQLASGTHKRYSGRTLRERRTWKDSDMRKQSFTINDEEVHGEVMLDQSAAVTHYRKIDENWKLKLGGSILRKPTEADSREAIEALPHERGELPEYSYLFDDSIIDLNRRNDFVNSTLLLKYHSSTLGSSLCDDYVMLLPFRIYGYAMLQRKWFPFNINLVSDITSDEVRITAAGLEDLVLPDGHKRLLQAVLKNRENQVNDLKQTKGAQAGYSNEKQMDLVREKGKGLTILLHGAPGVGMTSTAECVAAQLKRPMLPLTCGDISTDKKEAGKTLHEHFALADRWKCVILLEEADILLARREKGDIQRNGLVSVFLRILENFSGVVIMTTNRVSEIDEAFRSRIHVSLYYPELDQNATMQIWDRTLLHLRKSADSPDFSEDEIRNFAFKHWLENENTPSRRWNGRQIKNAFQTALALANWDFDEMKQGSSLKKRLLKAEHFERVAQTNGYFDDGINNADNISEVKANNRTARDEIRKDTQPAGILDHRGIQEFLPRSKRKAPARRGAGTLDARGGQSGKPEDVGDNARIRQLELELELMKLKMRNREEVQAQTEVDEDEEEEEEEEGWQKAP